MLQKGLPLRFRELYDYEREMHEKVLDSLETVSADRRRDGEFQNALDLLAHLLAARRMWLFRMVRRLGGEPAVTDFVFWTRQSID